MKELNKVLRKKVLGSQLVLGLLLSIVGGAGVYFLLKNVKESGLEKVPSSGKIFLALSAIIFFVGIGLLIKFLIGGPKYKLNKILKKKGISVNEFEKDMETAVRVDNLWFGEQYVLEATAAPVLLIYDQLIWAYPDIEAIHYRDKSASGKGKSTSYGLMVVDRENKEVSFPMENAALLNAAMQVLREKSPFMMVGYDDHLKRLRDKDFQTMVKRVDEEKEKFSINTTL